jgi:hypothetical protein
MTQEPILAESPPLPGGQFQFAIDVPSFAGSSIRVVSTEMDFVLVVGQLEAGMAGPIASRPVAKVVISPIHAKSLARILAQQVSAWEAKYGQLPATPSTTGQRPPSEQSHGLIRASESGLDPSPPSARPSPPKRALRDSLGESSAHGRP